MRTKNGMTLIEVIVAMAIFAIFVVMMVPTLAVINQTNTSSKEVIEATYISQDVAERVTAYSMQDGATPQGVIAYLSGDLDYQFSCSAYSDDSSHFSCESTNDSFAVELAMFNVEDSSNLKRFEIETYNRRDQSRSKVEVVVRFI